MIIYIAIKKDKLENIVVNMHAIPNAGDSIKAIFTSIASIERF